MEAASAQALYARIVHPQCCSLKEVLAKERLADSSATATAATATATAIATAASGVKLYGLSFTEWSR